MGQLSGAPRGKNHPGHAGSRRRADRSRPASGEPTGMLRELRYLIERVIPVPSLEARKKAVLLAQKDALRLGVTGVHTCERLEQWEAFDALDRAGDLKVRVYHLLPPEDLDDAAACGVRPAHGSERLWAGHVKLYADGSLGAGTALLHEPYTDEPGNSGLVVLDPASPAGENRARLPQRLPRCNPRDRGQGRDPLPAGHLRGAGIAPRTQAGPHRTRAALSAGRILPFSGNWAWWARCSPDSYPRIGVWPRSAGGLPGVRPDMHGGLS